jgi:hypothetical protein
MNSTRTFTREWLRQAPKFFTIQALFASRIIRIFYYSITIHGSWWMRYRLEYIKWTTWGKRRAWLLATWLMNMWFMYAWFTGSLQAGETNQFSRTCNLCLCQSYSVLTVCITNSLRKQANYLFFLGICNGSTRLYEIK